MTDQPQGVDIRFSSFADKGSYKPPAPTGLLPKKDAKRQRYVPGGDWVNEPEDVKPTKPAQPANPTKPVPTESFDDFIDITPPKPEASGSRFAFIRKPAKTEQTASLGTTSDDAALLDFDTVRSEKQ